jgi:TonB family protein
MSVAIGSEFKYPRQAYTEGISGNVLLCIAIDRDSHVIDAAIRHSSGSPLLDGEALIALGLAQMKDELPKLPPSYTLPPGKEFMMFSAPIGFRL